MPKATTAKLFQNGRSQAVRLPKEFRFEGDRVRIRKVGQGVLLEPMKWGMKKWFKELDRCFPDPFMEDGRNLPPPQERDFGFD